MELQPVFYFGVGVWLIFIALIKNDWIPIQRESLVHIHPLAKYIVMLPYIFLQSLDGLAVFRYGHQILYLTSRPSTAIYWLPLKIISSGGIFLSVICMSQAKRLSEEKISILTLFCTALTGSRGLLFFNLLSIVILRHGWKPLVRVKYLFGSIVVFLTFIGLGVFREGQNWDLNRLGYLYVQSLNEFVEANINTPDFKIERSAIITQLPSLAAGRIDSSRVTYKLTSNINPNAIDGGYGISSSSYGEFLILFGKNGGLFYPIVPLLFGMLLTVFDKSRYRIIKSLTPALLPYILYMARAELISPLIALFKAIIGLGIAMILNIIIQNTILGHRRKHVLKPKDHLI